MKNVTLCNYSCTLLIKFALHKSCLMVIYIYLIILKSDTMVMGEIAQRTEAHSLHEGASVQPPAHYYQSTNEYDPQN